MYDALVESTVQYCVEFRDDDASTFEKSIYPLGVLPRPWFRRVKRMLLGECRHDVIVVCDEISDTAIKVIQWARGGCANRRTNEIRPCVGGNIRCL